MISEISVAGEAREYLRGLARCWGGRRLMMTTLWLCVAPVQAADPVFNEAAGQGLVPAAPAVTTVVAMDHRYAQSDYEQQRQRILQGSGEVDFTALRLGFLHTANYAINSRKSTDLNRALFKAMDDNQFGRCESIAQQALALDYTNIQSHYGAMVCAFQLGHDERGQNHQWIVRGLVESLQASGSGFDPNRPYQAINANEVDGFLRLMGYEVKQRVSTQKDGKPLQVVTVREVQAAKTQQLFFDTSLYLESHGLEEGE